MKVAFLDDFHEAYAETDGVRRLREIADVEIFTKPIPGLDTLRGFEVLVATRERTKFSADVLAALSDVKMIVQTGNHAYHVDLEAAHKQGIIIAKATGGFCGAAGEMTIALMMAVMRQIPVSHQAIMNGHWPVPLTRVLKGKTLGIVGLGNIGKYVARIADAFGMNVIAWGGRLTPEIAAAAGAKACTLPELMREADVVSIHATLSQATRGLIDAGMLALMKPTAYIVNTARGAIIDEAALCNVLRDKKIAGAALDVFAVEPLPAESPLRSLDNVVLTPHLGWPTDEMYAQFADAAADAIIDFMNDREVAQFLADH